MRNTVPFASVEPISRNAPSSQLELSVGNEPVDQTTQLWWFSRPDRTFLQISPIFTMALPPSSWPVTTRRIFRDIENISTERFCARTSIACDGQAQSKRDTDMDTED